MMHFLRSLTLVSLMGAATATYAQETTPETGTEGESPDPLALNMGEPDIKVGDIYVEGEFTDWEIRCIKSEDGNDPCQLYQLLADPSGNSVAEINIFPMGGGEGQPAAGATIITPLETLLTQSLGLSVDGGQVRKYPFTWCSQIGCFSRLGFSESDVQAFRNGARANIIIVPVVAPDQTVSLAVSLSGFTAGFNAVKELMASRAAATE